MVVFSDAFCDTCFSYHTCKSEMRPLHCIRYPFATATGTQYVQVDVVSPIQVYQSLDLQSTQLRRSSTRLTKSNSNASSSTLSSLVNDVQGSTGE